MPLFGQVRFWRKADIGKIGAERPLLTQSGHWRAEHSGGCPLARRRSFGRPRRPELEGDRGGDGIGVPANTRELRSGYPSVYVYVFNGAGANP
jgi:hypothetical protein